jgi:hypothetical protein
VRTTGRRCALLTYHQVLLVLDGVKACRCAPAVKGSCKEGQEL